MEIARLDPKHFNEKLISGEYVLIDVRTHQEKLMYGYIEGVKHFFDVYEQSFVFDINGLDKGKKYLIYCFHGNRTQNILGYMKDQGFKCVYDLVGGIVSWENDGYKLIKKWH